MHKEAPSLTKKREEAIRYLGDKWILAKSNYVQKKQITPKVIVPK